MRAFPTRSVSECWRKQPKDLETGNLVFNDSRERHLAAYSDHIPSRLDVLGIVIVGCAGALSRAQVIEWLGYGKVKTYRSPLPPSAVKRVVPLRRSLCVSGESLRILDIW